MTRFSVFILCALSIWVETQAAILSVPDHFTTIQVALDSSSSGDTVLISAGLYAQSLTAPHHAVTIASRFLLTEDTTEISECILRPTPQSTGRNLSAANLDSAVMLRLVGLSLIGNMSGTEIVGGGVTVRRRNLMIESCHIDSCYGFFGGGIFAENCSVQVRNSRFQRTVSNEFGVVAYLDGCHSQFHNSTFSDGRSTRVDPSEYIFFVENGSFIARGCIVEGFGWDYVPGSHGVRQMGIPDSIVFVSCNFHHNRFHNFFRLPGEGILQSSTIRFDSNFVNENEFQHDLYSYFDADTGTTVIFRYNVFSNNGRLSEGNWVCRMLFTLSGETQRANVSYNLFIDNESQENSVALIGSPTDSADLRFTNNFMFGNSADGFANPPGGVTMLISVSPGVVYHNVFIESRGYAAFQGLDSSPPSNARNNYWGDSTGPQQSLENPLGLGDSVEYLVSVTPWAVDSSFDSENVSLRIPTPTDFVLGFPFPNPFNSFVSIEYALTREQKVEVIIFDLLGKVIERLVNQRQQIGVHQVAWNANSYSSGIYFAQLSASDSRQLPMTTKLLLLK